MKVFMAHYKTEYVKIAADRMEERDGVIFVYNGERLVGTFDLGTIDNCYLSEAAGR